MNPHSNRVPSDLTVNQTTVPRNVVICFDGTDDQFGPRNSNVIKLFQMIDIGEEQLAFYDSGVGTYLGPGASMWAGIARKVAVIADLAFAWDFKSHVTGAYQFLMDYYRSNDRIYIFGFSRGAYAARALAGMLQKVGLLPKGNIGQIPLAWDVYSKPDKMNKYCDLGAAGVHDEDGTARAYRATFSRTRNINVHFVGVWDTVSALGTIDSPSLPFASAVGQVQHFRHALALDERRCKFQPEYWHPESDPAVAKDNEEEISQMKRRANHLESLLGHEAPGLDKLQEPVKEVWFFGCHSDVGGGNSLNNTPCLANVPFRWMVREAVKCGLKVDPEAICGSKIFNEFTSAQTRAMIPPRYRPNASDTTATEDDWPATEELAHRIIYSAADDDARPLKTKEPLEVDLIPTYQESLTGLYWILEWLWLQRWVYMGHNKRKSVYVQNRGRARTLARGQKVHESVRRKLQFEKESTGHLAEGPTGGPKADPADKMTWQQLVLEMDDDPGLWEH